MKTGLPSASGAASPRISCKEVCEFLCDYIENDLPAPTRAEFEHHLRHCLPCAEYMKQYEETIRLARQCGCDGVTKPPPVPDDMVHAIMKAMNLPVNKPAQGGCCGGACKADQVSPPASESRRKA